MRLKPAGILIVLAVIAILAYLAFRPKIGNQTAELPNSQPNTELPADRNTTTTTTSTGNGTSAGESREFNYTPEQPENGTMRGVVEVGATGFNSFVINMDPQKRWSIVSKDFGESLAYEGLATTEDIRAGLKKYLSAMFDKGVSKNNMHFVISSGAQKEPKTGIISNELKKMGYVVNNVTAAEEAKFALRATIPKAFLDNSFMIDIGSGNTKISWEEGGALRTLELPGAKYYEKNVADEQVYNEVKAAMSKVPEGKRNVGFVLGGVPFTLANQHRKGEERYTVLKAPGDYKPVDKKMASGLNIYKGIADATGTDTFVFDWDANFTIGFLLSLSK
ncbi:MAG TPA: hypothetical protein VGB56_07225 [Flavisolibacter sp.]